MFQLYKDCEWKNFSIPFVPLADVFVVVRSVAIVALVDAVVCEVHVTIAQSLGRVRVSDTQWIQVTNKQFLCRV